MLIGYKNLEEHLYILIKKVNKYTMIMHIQNVSLYKNYAYTN